MLHKASDQMLPPVFAVYRAESESFQFLQPELAEDGSVVRLKSWSRPTFLSASKEEYSEPNAALWLKGQEWYVVPTYSTNMRTPPECHRVTIHGQSYVFWTLRHVLVWSNYIVHARRHSVSLEDWMSAPRIPILEFNTKLIYPRSDLAAIYPRWVEAKPTAVERMSVLGRSIYKDFTREEQRPALEALPDEAQTDHIHINPSELRIRTPRDDEEKVWHTEEELSSCAQACLAPKAKKRSWSDVSDLVEEELGSPYVHPNQCVRICALGTTAAFVSGFVWMLAGTIMSVL